MSVLIVSLALATACIGDTCFPVIVGRNTPVGQFSTYYAKTNQYGYSGEVLVFKETNTKIFAIHKPYSSPSRPNYRTNILLNGSVSERKISNGCINIPTDIFDKNKQTINQVIIE